MWKWLMQFIGGVVSLCFCCICVDLDILCISFYYIHCYVMCLVIFSGLPPAPPFFSNVYTERKAFLKVILDPDQTQSCHVHRVVCVVHLIGWHRCLWSDLQWYHVLSWRCAVYYWCWCFKNKILLFATISIAFRKEGRSEKNFLWVSSDVLINGKEPN